MTGLTKRKIKRMNTEVTFAGFGSLEIGRVWGMGADRDIPSEKESERVLNSVLDLGINLIDTASAYHKSEERIGKFLSHRRKEFILASKCGEHNLGYDGTYYDFSYKAIKESIEKSLRLLKTDVIDIMAIHFGSNPEETLDRGETVGAMKDARKEGKIKFLGASICGPLAKRCIESGDFDMMQMGHHLFYRDNEENIKLCAEKGIAVFIRSGMGNGMFTKRVLDNLDSLNEPDKIRIKKLLEITNNNAEMLTQLALQFLFKNENISSVLMGTKKIEHLKNNLNFLNKEINKEMWEKVEEIVRGEK
ncbi:MAG: aldo/keto reductase [Firmicutes bacterium]|nr:aldo/keto reductase [Bacillota bacterium]